MRSGHLLALLLVLEGLLTACAQITIGTSVAAAALGAAALGGVGLLALGAARRGSRRRSRRRKGRSADDELDLPSVITMRLAAAQDGSGCGQKLVCLLAASGGLTPLESDIVEFVQTRRAALGRAAPAAPAAVAAAVRSAGQRFQAAKQLGETGGDCAATYSGCSSTREQLTRFAAGRVAAARGRLDAARN